MNDALVSICLPVFNGAEFIRQTLESVVAQTYRDIEIVVSDNASTDGTRTIVEEFAREDGRIRYSRNEVNVGYCANVLLAVGLARSETVAIYHADDVYANTIIEKEYGVLSADPSIGGVFSTSLYLYTSDGSIRDVGSCSTLEGALPYDSARGCYVGDLKAYAPRLLEDGNFFPCPSFMTRKSAFLALGGFTDKYHRSEDLELWIKYLEAGWLLAIIREPLLSYRISETHASAGLRKSEEPSIAFKAMDEMLVARGGIDGATMDAYNMLKSRDYLIAAMNAQKLGHIDKMRENVESSKRIWKFSPFSRYGATQRFPRLALRAAAMWLGRR